ncbi:MAG: hypothetical protein N3F64_03520 [Nitrososphaeria archaeon]|nr:hypothetical protein [Nitrososphaeria archaeon]
MNGKAYGSGYFGNWFYDEHGLPAYDYQCNQLVDERAKTFTNTRLRNPIEHFHQIGNDRLVAIASNFGYVQVRQDEGGPKILNDYHPDNFQYAGGFGYLVSDDECICTFYNGYSEFKRIFGVGYFRKIISSKNYNVDQIIFAPYGDDPILISQVTIENKSGTPKSLRWIEYWGYQLYQLSFRHTIYAAIKKDLGYVVDFRREFSKRFRQKIEQLNGKGMIVKSIFKGYSISDKIKWFMLQILASTIAKKILGGKIKFPSKEIGFEDLTPPPVFLVSLNGSVDNLIVDAKKFFGDGGVFHPDGLRYKIEFEPEKVEHCALMLEKRFTLAPHEKCTLYFAYGYLPEGCNLDYLIKKYEAGLKDLWQKSSIEWDKRRIKFVSDESWVDRELLWHHYYLRSNLTFDTFFKEHILSQGSVYQYIVGFQGAARDPLQHLLPLIFTDPHIAKEIIRYTLKEVQPTGEIPYAITGHGAIMPSLFKPSDLQLWLLWATTEYILATKDTAFLEEKVRMYPNSKGISKEEIVYNILDLAYRYLVNKIGRGKHGLLRLSNGDWNDGIVVEYVPEEELNEVKKDGESVLNSAMAVYVLKKYAEVLDMIGKYSVANDVKKLADALKNAVFEQWTGKWFKRAWLSERLGWVGEDRLWLEPQPWAIISEIIDGEKLNMLLKNVEELVRKPSPVGAILLSKCIESTKSLPGVATNGGIWYSINGTLIWALAKTGNPSAWDEWKKNSLAMHAETYPSIWYGIWSGPDTYNSIYSKYPGATYFNENPENKKSPYGLSGLNWTDFPIMNMHSHAWPLYSLMKLINIEFTKEGVTIDPSIPKQDYSIESPLIGFKKSLEGYSGWYNPLVKGRYKIEIKLSKEELNKIFLVEVNSAEKDVILKDGKVIIEGETVEDGIRWKIILKKEKRD